MDNEFAWMKEADDKVSALLKELNEGLLSEKEFWSKLADLAMQEYDKAIRK